MKFFIALLALVSFNTYADDNAAILKEIQALKSRIVQLEQNGGLDSSSGLKVNNMDGQSMGSTDNSRLPASNTGSLDPQKLKEVQAQIEQLKKNTAAQTKYLNELLDE